MNVEDTRTCATEALIEYFKLINTLNHRKEEIVLPNKVRKTLSKFQNGNNVLNNYLEQFSSLNKNFYTICINYLNKCCTNMKGLQLLTNNY